MSKECGCKGIRSCKICEDDRSDGFPELKNNASTYEFVYDHETKTANKMRKDGKTIEYYFTFPGVEIIQNFVSEGEEKNLIKNINNSTWKISQSGRLKQDYGPKANFKRKKVKTGAFTGLPQYSKYIIDRMKTIEILNSFQTVELCNLQYCPERGSSIDPHFDDFWLWGERLVTLNLKSSTWLTMTLPVSCEALTIVSKNGQNFDLIDEGVSVKIPLYQRSLVVLYGDARYKWKHEIHRSDIQEQRLCCTLRELSQEFLTGERKNEGLDLLSIASTFNGTVTTA